VAAYKEGRPPFADLGRPGVRRVGAGLWGGRREVAWDEPIRQSMAEASAVVGEGVGTPALGATSPPARRPARAAGLAAADGTDAVRPWDAVVAFAAVPGVLEVSRPRPRRSNSASRGGCGRHAVRPARRGAGKGKATPYGRAA